MKTRTHSCGVLLWVDDRFAQADLTEVSGAPWSRVFGSVSDRVYRLLDLRLQVAASYAEALQALAALDRDTGRAYVHGVVDLALPKSPGEDPAVKYGIALGRELMTRGVPFVFLSANTQAMAHLERAGLGSVPYYVKEVGGDRWRLPSPVALMALAEFRSSITWITLDDLLGAMHPESDFVATSAREPESFRYFPFFGPFREFVERCEYGLPADPSRTMVVRCARNHCDAFVQQCLSILLYDTVASRPGTFRLRYAQAHDSGALHNLCRTDAAEDPHTVAVLRVWPERCPPERFKALLQETGRRSGSTLFVVPNDETSEPYVEQLRDLRVHAPGDLPQLVPGDSESREELVRRTCSLVFQEWLRSEKAPDEGAVSDGYLCHPELLVNPICWETLIKPERVAEALSDPYEILLEFGRAFRGLQEGTKTTVLEAVFRGAPLGYEHLLRVGDQTFLASEYGAQRGEWVEATLDAWLETSWDFPYGIGSRFLRSWVRPCEGGGRRPSVCRVSAQGETSCGCREAKGCGVWEAWQDSAFEILTGILGEYEPVDSPGLVPLSRRSELRRAKQFVEALGSRLFLAGPGGEHIDWESLEYLRWPHQSYPLPSAVTRRLRAAGRYLWIQPEGVDLATALPTGRARYRALGEVAGWYASVLGWGAEVAGRLPLGWREAVGYLVDVVSQHRAAQEWRERPGHLWQALLALLRNGLPVMYIAQRIAQGGALAGEDGGAERFLRGVKGYGTILGPVRKAMGFRLGGFLQPVPPVHLGGAGSRSLKTALSLLDAAGSGEEGASRLEAVGRALIALGRVVADPGAGEDIGRVVCAFQAAPEFGLMGSEGWYVEPTAKVPTGGGFPSLRGLMADHLWYALEALAHVEWVTRRFRRFDGYHFLACVNDLRVESKDTRPDVPFEAIETVLDLFVASVEALVAQLAWCVRWTGHPGRARPIEPPGIRVVPPKGFSPPDPAALDRVLTVKEDADEWAVYTLGIPGRGSASRLCCHHVNRVVRLDPEDGAGRAPGAARPEARKDPEGVGRSAGATPSP